MSEILNTCYETTNLSHPIAYYSHIVPIAVFLLIGGFVLLRSKENGLKGIFSLFIATFSLWLVGDLITWVVSDYYLVYAFWSTLDFLEIAFFVLGAYFVTSLVYDRQVPLLLRIFFPIILLIPFVITIIGNATHEFSHSVCESLENDFLTHFRLYVEILILAYLVYLGLRVSRLPIIRKGPAYAIIAALFLFLGTFSLSSYLASLTFHYEILFYGLLALPVFFIVLVYSITNSELFHVRAFGIQVLIYLILILISSQYLFITSSQNRVLTGITLVLTAVFGYLFQQSALRETKQREHIEKLATELKSANGQLESANDRLKELDKMKSEFLSIASHQLRAPITAIKGYSSLIKEGEYGVVSAQLKQPIENISESARQMAQSVDDYLNISRIEQGRMKFEFAKADIADLAKKVTEELGAVAEGRGLKLSINAPTPVEAMIDFGKTKQIVTNLVDNALKYTKQGSVAVAVEAIGTKARITVADTGMGISKDDIPKLFSKFTRAAGANEVNTSGTGLGLYVVKLLAEGEKGTVRVESDGPGKGSRFIVELPL